MADDSNAFCLSHMYFAGYLIFYRFRLNMEILDAKISLNKLYNLTTPPINVRLHKALTGPFHSSLIYRHYLEKKRGMHCFSSLLNVSLTFCRYGINNVPTENTLSKGA